ncbi:hypothetical protein BC826DRAFT_201507 [Russula brevipes]|nr:hypothetical protein BC826DRAFT_201507 [Russula brevipes]
MLRNGVACRIDLLCLHVVRFTFSVFVLRSTCNLPRNQLVRVSLRHSFLNPTGLTTCQKERSTRRRARKRACLWEASVCLSHHEHTIQYGDQCGRLVSTRHPFNDGTHPRVADVPRGAIEIRRLRPVEAQAGDDVGLAVINEMIHLLAHQSWLICSRVDVLKLTALPTRFRLSGKPRSEEVRVFVTPCSAPLTSRSTSS